MEQRFLDLSRYVCFDGSVGKFDGETLDFTFTKGDFPELKFFLEQPLTGYNCFQIDIKIDPPTSEGVTLILYSRNLRAICGLYIMVGHRDFDYNQWHTYTWQFRNEPGWITPPSTLPFDFDNAYCLGIVASGSMQNFKAHIRNARFAFDPVFEERRTVFNDFLSTYRAGSLKNKKALIWANGYGEGNEGCTVQGVIKAFDYYERLKGYDGLVLDFPDTPATCFRDTLFTHEDLDEEVLYGTMEAYKAWDWKQYKHNFIRTDIAGMNRFKNADGSKKLLDWFDDELFEKHILPKCTKFAAALRDANLSFMFDNETYDTEPYDYYQNYKKTGRSFEEYEAQVFQRGKQFAEAYARGNPDGTIMFLQGNWVIRLAKDEDWYGLMPAFLDGMCAADTDLKLIDGYEKGYLFDSNKTAAMGVYDCTRETHKLSSNPALFKEKIGYGFATWLRTDFLDRKMFSDILIDALRGSQEYVWIYTEASPIQRPDVQEHFRFAGEELLKARAKENK